MLEKVGPLDAGDVSAAAILPRLLMGRRVPDEVAERACREYDVILSDHDLSAEEVIRISTEQGSAALLAGSRNGLTAKTIAALPNSLRIIANPSAGFDHMDVAAAKARGIVVTNAPTTLTECTADFTFMLILNACRRAAEYFTIMRAGWRKPFGMSELLGTRANGRTLGIVGFGRIGRAVARRAAGFNMRVLYTDRARLPESLEDGAEFVADLREMLPRCDILSLHAPGGAGIAPLMTEETFALLPRGAVFVNAARGSLVDEEALLGALRSGHLFGAALDVFRKEPDFDLRLAELPNVFLTPHMGSATQDTRNAMGFRALDNIAAVLAGHPALDLV